MNAPACPDPLLDVAGIAEHLYGEVTPYTTRRVRHLIDQGVIPVLRLGQRRLESKRSWLDALTAKPDTNGKAEK